MYYGNALKMSHEVASEERRRNHAFIGRKINMPYIKLCPLGLQESCYFGKDTNTIFFFFCFGYKTLF